MGWGFRKSIKLGGGMRLNVGKRGIGISGGIKGLRLSTGPSGTRMRASLPGTGLYYQKSLGSSRSRSVRSAEQKRRELIQSQERINALNAASYEVEVFQNRIDVLRSLHNDCSEKFDWEAIKDSSPPFQPDQPGPREKKVLDESTNFRPTWRDILFNRAEIKRIIILDGLDEAKNLDQKEYEEWEILKQSASNVLEGDLQTYMDIIRDFSPFSEISDLGSRVNVSTNDSKYLEATIYVYSEKVIPNEEKTMTKTGKLSVKQMTKTRFYEIYQDYVCSCVLRVARELFALLPIESAIINVYGEVLNPKTGYIEESPIFSGMIPRKSLDKLLLDQLDCSDAMVNFVHNMDFKKTKGFAVVNKITPDQFERS